MTWAALVLAMAAGACGGRHVWVDDGFIVPVPRLYQFCKRHNTYHEVGKRHGRDSKTQISGRALTL